ncbi:uncharacterized protein METZ01_LOCUS294063, partial [marine metagenome]
VNQSIVIEIAGIGAELPVAEEEHRQGVDSVSQSQRAGEVGVSAHEVFSVEVIEGRGEGRRAGWTRDGQVSGSPQVGWG